MRLLKSQGVPCVENWILDKFLNERVATLKGLLESIFDKVYARIHFNKGAKELVDELTPVAKVGLVLEASMRRLIDWQLKQGSII